jgi:hypothetical protein
MTGDTPESAGPPAPRAALVPATWQWRAGATLIGGSPVLVPILFLTPLLFWSERGDQAATADFVATVVFGLGFLYGPPFGMMFAIRTRRAVVAAGGAVLLVTLVHLAVIAVNSAESSTAGFGLLGIPVFAALAVGAVALAEYVVLSRRGAT